MFGVNLILQKMKLHVMLEIIILNLVGQVIMIICMGKDEIGVAFQNFLAECFYTIVFIFLNGPLKVWLEIKEGKTSLKKILEDYEDERNLVHDKFGLKKPDLLPTTEGTAK